MKRRELPLIKTNRNTANQISLLPILSKNCVLCIILVSAIYVWVKVSSLVLRLQSQMNIICYMQVYNYLQLLGLWKKESLIIASFDSSFGKCKNIALSIAQAGILYKTTWRKGKREREVSERNHRSVFSKTAYQGSGINGLQESCLEKSGFIDL